MRYPLYQVRRQGVKVSYDGECCLAVERGDYQTAITAYPGEIVTLIYSRGQATTVQGIKKPLAK